MIVKFIFIILTMASTTSSAFSDEEEEQPVYEFPKTLKEFGFKFNEKGELRNIETDKPFDFMARKINKPQTEEEKLLNLNERRDHQRYNQKRYEALGEIITDYVYDLLEKETKLKRVYIPDDAEEDEPKSFVFMSEGALTNPKLLLIIHGSGVVRAGQWSRRLIINNNLDKGTQLPYIKKGLELGFGIIVFNTNLNKVKINGKEHLVRLNETPEDHGMYVWKYIVQNAKATNIGIVAHSYGGIVTLEMASLFEDDFLNRVFGIGFTDSVHSYKHQLGVEDVAIVDFLRERAMNYVSSDKALGTPVVSFESHDCPAVSAGTDQHELTSWSCFDLLFTFLQEKYKVYATKVDQSGGGDDKPGSSKSTSTERDQQQASGDTQQTEPTTKIKSEL